ncbi:MAG: type II toxin-antitoxin system HipA family toxin [Coriobacteriales bacterium]|jgi:serine/threonine-protein kinase HipA|nr:type II toxin-antitoxin system HipA family toxin [Coriobacteriales bacterium]
MRLHICRQDNRIGELYASKDGTHFSYSAEYLGSGGIPLSVSMPLREEPFPQNIALPFFDGLLPEGEQRRELGEVLHVAPASTMKMLSALAGECVGDLILVDDETDIAQALADASYVSLQTDDLEKLLRPQSLERTRFIAAKRLSLAGAQAKIGLFWEQGQWFATRGLAPTTHIIKPASQFDPTVLVNEFFMMRLAKSCGLDVPETWITRAGAHCGFVVERFDRLKADGEVIRLGQEDYCQALSVMPEAKYESDGGPGLRDLFATALLHTTPPRPNLQKLLQAVIFNYLTGNCDAHAKNFSLLRGPDSTSLSLAPAYDLVCTTFYGERLLSSMAMRLGLHSRIDRVDARDFALFAEEAGISLKEVASTMTLLRDAITRQIDAVLASVTDEAAEYAQVARELRDHLLRSMESRVSL